MITMRGPMPTDTMSPRPRRDTSPQQRGSRPSNDFGASSARPCISRTGDRDRLPAVLMRREAVGVGLHLLPPTSSGAVVYGSLAGMTEDAHTDDVRELADVPAVEVISRAAVMLMSSA